MNLAIALASSVLARSGQQCESHFLLPNSGPTRALWKQPCAGSGKGRTKERSRLLNDPPQEWQKCCRPGKYYHHSLPSGGDPALPLRALRAQHGAGHRRRHRSDLRGAATGQSEGWTFRGVRGAGDLV